MVKPKVVLICGSRFWTNWLLIKNFLHTLDKGTVIIHGACKGADYWAGYLGEAMGMVVKPYPADWNRYKKAAGPIRNKQMLDENPDIDLVVAFHNDIENSSGTKDMRNQALARGIEVEIVTE